MKILTFSTLFPNREQPAHGLFVEERLRHLLAGGRVESRVVAPVPWFPLASERFGRYGAFCRVPRFEERHGLRISHPRYLVIPRIGMHLTPWTLAAASWGSVRQVRREGHDFQLIDAHYFYPDGVAAALLGQRLGVPVVITARGTDVNLIPRDPLPRRRILWAGRQAAAVITVCQALREALIDLGMAADKITVLRNGVDPDHFRPMDRVMLRRELGLHGTVLLSAGHLVARKGHDLVIGALPFLPEVHLVIVGEGPERGALEQLALRLGVADRVRFAGLQPRERMPLWFNGADALVLASDREGWANVLLEAMACGTPVLATPVWGTPEVVNSPDAG
ncbi:MAG: glycosyltransferase family 4 protein, partial [Magnetococcales bacterium]|nr:glycosyltransferase family 4 protein [Magnetococcales bacterium]